MARVMTLQKQKRSLKSTQKVQSELELKKNAPVLECSATERLLDEKFIAQAVWECLKNNDPEGVIEIIQTHLQVVNKVKAAKKNNLSRATMYNAIRRGNPTIRTLARLVNCCA